MKYSPIKNKQNIFFIVIFMILVILTMLFISHLTLTKNNKTSLEGKWVSNKQKTLKFFGKEMGHLKEHLGKFNFTFKGSSIIYEDTQAVLFFSVLKENKEEITIKGYRYMYEIMGDINLLFFFVAEKTFIFEDDCIVFKKEYFCRE